MKSIIIFGGSGYVGKNLIKSFVKKGYKIITTPAKWKKRIEGYSSITIKSYFSYLKVFWKNL